MAAKASPLVTVTISRKVRAMCDEEQFGDFLSETRERRSRQTCLNCGKEYGPGRSAYCPHRYVKKDGGER